MASHQSSKTEKNVRLILIYVVKCTIFTHFFQFLNFHGLPFLGKLRSERVIYLKRKPYYPLFDRSFEIVRILVMEGSRWILVKVVLFQLKGRGHPQGDAMLNFFPDSKSTIIGLSNEASFVSRYYCKISENWEKEESIIQPYVSKRGKL